MLKKILNFPKNIPPKETIKEEITKYVTRRSFKDKQIKYTLEGDLALKRRNAYLKNHLSIIGRT